MLPTFRDRLLRDDIVLKLNIDDQRIHTGSPVGILFLSTGDGSHR